MTAEYRNVSKINRLLDSVNSLVCIFGLAISLECKHCVPLSNRVHLCEAGASGIHQQAAYD